MKRAWFIGLFVFPLLVTAQHDRLEWYNFFYLPYDNDLNGWADTILYELDGGLDTSTVVNIAYVELPGAEKSFQMRMFPEHSSRTAWKPPFDIDGSSIDIENRDRSEHSAFYFLGHGGRLDEVRQRTSEGESWMSIAELRSNLEEENEYLQKFDLFFFQVCSKGSIEAMYEVAEIADYSMASQFPIGAPNYYYKEVLDEMVSGVIGDGHELGLSIAEHDRSDMFLSYSIYDNFRLTTFTDSLLSYITVPQNLGHIDVDLNVVKDTEYGGEKYMDLRDLLPILKRNKVLTKKQYRHLKLMLPSVCTTVLSPALEGDIRKSIGGFSGISVLLGTQKVSGDYSKLKMYQSEEWRSLMEVLQAK
jgi:hypothetical protein